jgi:hypothetical protein
LRRRGSYQLVLATTRKVDVARKPQEPVRWSILILRAKAVWLGDVEAASEAEAIKIGAEHFGQPKERLMLSAVRERTAMKPLKMLVSTLGF